MAMKGTPWGFGSTITQLNTPRRNWWQFSFRKGTVWKKLQPAAIGVRFFSHGLVENGFCDRNRGLSKHFCFNPIQRNNRRGHVGATWKVNVPG